MTRGADRAFISGANLVIDGARSSNL